MDAQPNGLADLQLVPGVVKTHTSEMGPGGAERREVKWGPTSPKPSEIA